MKKCGYKEECFVPGGNWGHHESRMCLHLSERDKISVCLKDMHDVDFYYDDKSNVEDIVVYTKEMLLTASSSGKKGKSHVLTTDNVALLARLTKNITTVSSSEANVFFFTNDHCFGVDVLPDHFVPCSTTFPMYVTERPGLEDGCINTVEKYIQIFESDMRQITTVEELVDFLNQHVA